MAQKSNQDQRQKGRPQKELYKQRLITDDQRNKWAAICNDEYSNGYFFIGEDRISANQVLLRFQKI